MVLRVHLVLPSYEQEQLKILISSFETQAWTIDVSTDIETAVKMLQETPVDLIVLGMDIELALLKVQAEALSAQFLETIVALLVLGKNDYEDLEDHFLLIDLEKEDSILSCFNLVSERHRLVNEHEDLRTLGETLDRVRGERNLPLLVGRHLASIIETLSCLGGCVLAKIHGRAGLQIVASHGLDENYLKGLCSHFEGKRNSKLVEKDREGVFLSENCPSPEEGKVIGLLLREGAEDLGALILTRRSSEPFLRREYLAVVFAARNLRLVLANDRSLQFVTSSARNLEGLQKQLIQAEKMVALGQLAAGIAHEINNPLTAIMGFAELMVREIGGQNGAYLRKIVSNAERVKRILLDLKDFYVPAQHRKSAVSLNQIIRNAIPIIQVHPERRNIQVHTDLHDGVGNVFADENQLLQVVINLLMNAFQSMPNGGSIRIATWPEGDYVFVGVTDQGCGIEPDNLNRIFDPFFTTKTDWKGTGLGLAVCYTIIEDHGGEIGVQSVLGEGSSFSVRLPRLEEDLPISSNHREINFSEIGDPVPEKRLRLLVVDDEPDCRSLMQELFRGFGHVVVEADCGDRAIEICSSEEFDVVFLDYKMPGLSGLETFERLRKLRPAMKIVIVTGSIGVTAEGQLRGSADDFLRKPFRAEEILASLNALRDRPTTDRCISHP